MAKPLPIIQKKPEFPLNLTEEEVWGCVGNLVGQQKESFSDEVFAMLIKRLD